MSYEQSEPMSKATTWVNELATPNDFPQRHIGLTEPDINQMLSVLGYNSLGALIDTAVPAEIR
ncbi:MAG: hypothetical protein AAGB19_20445, partial [Cyanobacteria bacterium P01_F01_bin.3]